MNTAYAAYRQTAIQTASRDRLLLMVFDGLLSTLTAAKSAIEANDVAQAHAHLTKAQTIIREGLWGVLDPQYEISKQLASLYEYCVRRLIEANVRKQVEPVDEVARHMRDLRAAFAGAAVRARQEGANASSASGETGTGGHSGQTTGGVTGQ
jgi:flagellar protein FliS